MATRKKISPQQVQANTIVIAIGALLALYGLLLLLWILNATGSLSAVLNALRLGLLMAITAIGGTYFYLRGMQKPAAARAAATGSGNGAGAFKKEVETWMAGVTEAIKNKTSFDYAELPAEVESLRNHTKLNAAWQALLSELEGLKSDGQRTAATIAQKEKQVKSLQETIAAKEGEISQSKAATEAAQRKAAQQQQEFNTLTATAEKQQKEAGSKMDRYRNISKFLEGAKAALYSRHGTGKEFLVQLKLGLLADDVINLTNKNDYFSLNYELFRNGRPFEQLVREQPPVHIDAYPDSVKKLRAWIKSNGLESEDWDLFYQNYPVTDRVIR